MEENKNCLLQFTDSLTDRKCLLRIEQQDASLTLKDLLQKYLKNAPIERLLEEGRIAHESAETLSALQDLVYLSADNGQLGDMFGGVIFRQAQTTIDLNSTPVMERVTVQDTPVLVMNISIDRLNALYERNWVGFHKRRWMRHDKLYSDFVMSTLERESGRSGAEAILQLESKEDKLRLVQILARAVWESDFENYSRFTGQKLAYKTGDETVLNIMGGAGAVCSEKVQALKFITDHYGLPSEYLLAGVDVKEPIPETKLRNLLETFDFRFSKRYMRYWQHTALLYSIDDTTVLVDATNGNIPLLFLTDASVGRMLGEEDKQPVTVKMVDSYEDMYYHRVSQDIPEKFFHAMEGWIEYIDLIQVFENELGLYLSEDFLVTPIVFRGARDFAEQKQEYVQVCNQAGLEYAVSSEWMLDSRLGQQFVEQAPRASERVMQSREQLLKRYNEWEGLGHEAGLFVIRLSHGKNGAGNTRR